MPNNMPVLPYALTPTYYRGFAQEQDAPVIAPFLRHIEIPKSSSFASPAEQEKFANRLVILLGGAGLATLCFPMIATWIPITLIVLAFAAEIYSWDASLKKYNIDYKNPEQLKHILRYLSTIKLDTLYSHRVTPEKFQEWLVSLCEQNVIDLTIASMYSAAYKQYCICEGRRERAEIAYIQTGQRQLFTEPQYPQHPVARKVDTVIAMSFMHNKLVHAAFNKELIEQKFHMIRGYSVEQYEELLAQQEQVEESQTN